MSKYEITGELEPNYIPIEQEEDFGVDPEYYRKSKSNGHEVVNGEWLPVEQESNVEHPKHYNFGDIEVIDYIHDQNLDFNLGNAIKYISRAGLKDENKKVEDLEKAIFYINDEIERIKGESPKYIKQRGTK